MKSDMSLGDFKFELKSFTSFELKCDDPLFPSKFRLKFDYASVVLGACPYLSFKNDIDSLCLHGIESIKKKPVKDGVQQFLLYCSDCTTPNGLRNPGIVPFSLNCI